MCYVLDYLSLQNNCVKCNNIVYVVIRFIWKLYPNKLILPMVSCEIDNIRTPSYYVWTIVNTVIGHQRLLNVSNWLDHLKCVCLNGIVLIVYVHYWTFRSPVVYYPFAEGPGTSQFVLYMCLICSYFHCHTVNHWFQFYYVVLAQPFHSSLCSVHHSSSTVALMLSIILLHSTLTSKKVEHHFPSTHTA